MIQQPSSMDDCLYFTRRSLGSGNAIAWVYRKPCPKCGKATMGKPASKGKVKIRATEYVCPACNHVEQKIEHEQSLQLQVIYRCPSCGHEADISIPYKRTLWNGVQAYVFSCGKCAGKIGLTKKMKNSKKSANANDDDDD